MTKWETTFETAEDPARHGDFSWMVTLADGSEVGLCADRLEINLTGDVIRLVGLEWADLFW